MSVSSNDGVMMGDLEGNCRVGDILGLRVWVVAGDGGAVLLDPAVVD